MNLEIEIDRLEHQLRLLKVEFEKFFAGALPIPPEPVREEFKTQLKLLRNRGGKSAVDRFRLGNIEANFNSVSELLNRRLRAHEMGKTPSAGKREATRQAQHNAREGIVFGQKQDNDATMSLYKDLYGKRGSKATDLHSFEKYLSNQIERIRAKTGCASVQFRVAEENGKLKLKAKALKDA